MFKLREYQEDCLGKILEGFTREPRQLVQLPTGGGKTVIFWEYIKRESKRTLVIVPSLQLMRQCFETGWEFGMKGVTSLKGGKDRGEIRQHHIVIANSLKPGYIQKLLSENFDTIICDEAHRSVSRLYLEFFEAYTKQHPSVKILGMTATPERSDAISLLEVFKKLTYTKEIYELIAEGYLSELKAYRVKTNIQIKKAKLLRGDFTTGTLMKYLNNDQRNQLILESYEKYCLDRKTIVFCINRKHSQIISDSFNAMGVSSVHIDGSMPFAQRNAILHRFKNGEIKVLTNCQLLTEGFDEPSITAVILARPTKSRTLYAQMIGRGVRLHPGKENCVVVDIADNYHSICNFSVMGGFPSYLNFDYPDGATVRELRAMAQEMELDVVSTEDEVMDLFNVEGFFSKEAIFSQLNRLRSLGIKFYDGITYEEAAFLLWKDNFEKTKRKVMANIEERATGSGEIRYKCVIRKKGQYISGTFATRHDAEIWATWKESLISNVEAFDVPKGDLVTLQDAIDQKIKEVQAKDVNSRFVTDIANDMECWVSEFGKDTVMNTITYDSLLEATKKLLQTQVQRGGVPGRKDTGTWKAASPGTVRRRLASWSTCVSLLQRNGCNIENHAIKIMAWMRQNLGTS